LSPALADDTTGYGSGKPSACCNYDNPVAYNLADMAMALLKML
jgi:hypothetical protein